MLCARTAAGRDTVRAGTQAAEPPVLKADDFLAALAVSRGIALAMLFLGGLALGRYAGYGSWKVGFMMVGLGAVLVAAIIALGG